MVPCRIDDTRKRYLAHRRREEEKKRRREEEKKRRREAHWEHRAMLFLPLRLWCARTSLARLAA
jgi:hypothetical protein